MAITSRHVMGWNSEEILKSTFERIHNMKIIKTVKRYDTIDFINPNLNIELKSRVGTKDTYPDWLLPVIKAKRAESDIKERPTIFYYYWTGDNTLFKLDYNKERFDTYRKEYPHFNPKQETYYIPASEWTYVETISK